MIEAYTLGLGMVAGALGCLGLQGLREERGEPQSLADALGYDGVLDRKGGIFRLKDGGLLRLFWMQGPDCASSTGAALNGVRNRVMEALLVLDAGWVVHDGMVRRRASGYAPAGAFPDRVTALFDAQRREAYESGNYLENRYFIALTYLPPRDGSNKLSQLLFGDEGEELAAVGVRNLEHFKSASGAFADRLRDVLKLEAMGAGEAVTCLHSCVTGLEHALGVPDGGEYLSDVIGYADVEQLGAELRVGEKFFSVIGVREFPDESWPGFLDELNDVPFPFRLSQRLILVEKATALRRARSAAGRHYGGRHGMGELVVSSLASGGNSARNQRRDEVLANADAENMASQASAAAAEASSGRVPFAYYTVVLVVGGDTVAEVRGRARALEKIVQDHGFATTRERQNLFRAFLSSLPGDGTSNVRKPLTSGIDCANLMPITSIWAGLEHNPSSQLPAGSPALMWAQTRGSNPFRVNVDDKAGHALLLGPTRAGKTAHLLWGLAMFRRYPGAWTRLFDVDRSGFLFAKATGATHLAFGATGSKLGLQALRRIDDIDHRKWAVTWIGALLLLQDKKLVLTPHRKRTVERALDTLAGLAPERRTMTELMIQVQDAELKLALRAYTRQGAHGDLFDVTEDGLSDADHVVFEMRPLMDRGPEAMLPALLYIFRDTAVRAKAGRPGMIGCDEVWRSMMVPEFREWLLDVLRTFAKLNIRLVLATQEPGDIYNNPDRDVILMACTVRIFTPNPDAVGSAAEMYEAFQLNEAERRIIAESQRQREYYYWSPSGSRRYELGLPGSAEAFLFPPRGMPLEEVVETVEELERLHGDGWQAVWLEQLGMHDLAKRLTPTKTGAEPHAYDVAELVA